MSQDEVMLMEDGGEPPQYGRDIDIAKELHKSFLTYAMSVIVARALPDSRDGLKPVHRRILYAMKIGKYTSDKPYKKSARIVGDVMGQLHPHGDSSIYDAMVRMAQDFKMRRPLIDGQGNYGSIDDDPAAAMRYTEARLDAAGEELLKDIELGTVDFCPNYDNSMQEPTVMPARVPNLLINGSSGIAVGMATDIPPHNPLEAIDACIALVRNPFITLDEILEILPGPDFPTGASLHGRALLRNAYETGRGSVPVRAKADIETVRIGRSKEERKVIAFTEIPYNQNKAKLAEMIGELADKEEKDGGIPGIADVRDESGREGIRIAVDLKKDADPEAVLAHIYKKTPLQQNVQFNMVALDFSSGEARPETMSLMDLLRIFIEHRRTVIKRRSAFELVRNRSKLHAQVALLAALDEIDAVIALIRRSADNAEARAGLMEMRFRIHGLLADVVSLDPDAVVEESAEAGGERVLRLDEEQARTILDLRLQRLSGMERDELAAEARGFAGMISDLLSILNNPVRRDEVLIEELEKSREAVPKDLRARRTVIHAAPLEIRGDNLEMVPREDVLVTLTMNGYVKRVPLTAFNTQKRGGTGKTGARPDSEDAVALALRVTTHDSLLVVTSRGMAYSLRVHLIPASDPSGRGKPIVGLIEALSGGKERITAVLPMPANAAALGDEESLVFVTDQGTVRRNPLSAFARINALGKIAMRLEGEAEDGQTESLGELIAVLRAAEHDDVILFTQKGKFCRFAATDVRESKGRDSMGVRGIDIRGSRDRVVGAAVLAAAEADADLRESFLKARRAGLEVSGDPQLAPLAASESILLSVTENGFGKRSSSHEYRATNRGTKGYTAADLTAKTGNLAACVQVGLDDEVMLTTRKGMSIRMKTADIVLQGRSTCGVKLMRLDPDDAVQAAIRLAAPQDEALAE